MVGHLEDMWKQQHKILNSTKQAYKTEICGTDDNWLHITIILYCQVLNILGEKFGTSVNSKGYKMLPPYIRVVQGDGISYETVGEICDNLKKNGWSTGKW